MSVPKSTSNFLPVQRPKPRLFEFCSPAVSALYVKVPEKELTFLLLANNDHLSANIAWTRVGVRASPFARAFFDAFVFSEAR